MANSLPAIQETWVWSLGWKHPLEKEITTHSSILAYRISWTEEPGELPSMGLQRVRHDWVTSAAKSLQSCLTLCTPGSPVPGILQARTLGWVAISFSNIWKWKVKVKLLSRVLLLVTPWTSTYQVPPSMGFSRQEYCSGLPLPSPDWVTKHAISTQ